MTVARERISIAELKKIISSCMDEIYFSYNGKPAGACAEVTDYKMTFTLWYGDDTKDFDDIDEVMTSAFFDGKSLSDLVDIVEIEIA